jgi:hypothetical protein
MVSSLASSFFRSAMAVPIARKYLPRSPIVFAAQPGAALYAAATALSISFGEHLGANPTTFPFAGLITSVVSPVGESSSFPLINIRYCLDTGKTSFSECCNY